MNKFWHKVQHAPDSPISISVRFSCGPHLGADRASAVAVQSKETWTTSFLEPENYRLGLGSVICRALAKETRCQSLPDDAARLLTAYYAEQKLKFAEMTGETFECHTDPSTGDVSQGSAASEDIGSIS